MYILTSIQNDVCQVFNTNTGALQNYRLQMILVDIKEGRCKVAGLDVVTKKNKPDDAVAIYNTGFYFSQYEAKVALYRHYTGAGIPENMARMKVGL